MVPRNVDPVPIHLYSDEVFYYIKLKGGICTAEKRIRFKNEYKLSDNEIDILVGDKPLSEFYERVIKEGTNPKAAANWILGDLLRMLKEKRLTSEQIPI